MWVIHNAAAAASVGVHAFRAREQKGRFRRGQEAAGPRRAGVGRGGRKSARREMEGSARRGKAAIQRAVDPKRQRAGETGGAARGGERHPSRKWSFGTAAFNRSCGCSEKTDILLPSENLEGWWNVRFSCKLRPLFLAPSGDRIFGNADENCRPLSRWSWWETYSWRPSRPTNRFGSPGRGRLSSLYVQSPHHQCNLLTIPVHRIVLSWQKSDDCWPSLWQGQLSTDSAVSTLNMISQPNGLDTASMVSWTTRPPQHCLTVYKSWRLRSFRLNGQHCSVQISSEWAHGDQKNGKTIRFSSACFWSLWLVGADNGSYSLPSEYITLASTHCRLQHPLTHLPTRQSKKLLEQRCHGNMAKLATRSFHKNKQSLFGRSSKSV